MGRARVVGGGTHRMVTPKRDILLAVAAEIEADERYTGESYLHPEKNPTGCASIRIIRRAGGDAINENGISVLGITEPWTVFRLPNFREEGDNAWCNTMFLSEALAKATGIPKEEWKKFLVFSISAGRYSTARKLRSMHEIGRFQLEL